MRYLKLFENFDSNETMEVRLQNCLDDCTKIVFKCDTPEKGLDICESKISDLERMKLPFSHQSDEFNELYMVLFDTILWVEDFLEMKYEIGPIIDKNIALRLEKKYKVDTNKLESDPLKQRCYDLHMQLSEILFPQNQDDSKKMTNKMSKEEIQDLVNTYLDNEDYEGLKKLSQDPNLSWFFK